MKLFLITLLTAFLSSTTNSCSNNGKPTTVNKDTVAEPIQTERKDGLKNAYFASGCFWCVEGIYESVKGVEEVISGYAGGHVKNPTYRQVSYGKTGHAETVEVQYDPNIISFKELVTVYYASQDPTTFGQKPDFGSAYRSVVFYQNAQEKEIIEFTKNEIQKELANKKVVTEVLPFQKFWPAEAYHQDFEKRNPTYPYIVRISIPRLNRFKAKHPELLKP